jgi:hypothetical protein
MIGKLARAAGAIAAVLAGLGCNEILGLKPTEPNRANIHFEGCFTGATADPPSGGELTIVLEAPDQARANLVGCMHGTRPLFDATVAGVASLDDASAQLAVTPAGFSALAMVARKEPTGELDDATTITLVNQSGSFPFASSAALSRCTMTCADLGLASGARARAPASVPIGALARVGAPIAEHVGIFDAAVAASPTQAGPDDARFFGTYCLATPKRFCKSIPVLPDPCVTVNGLKAHLEHTTASGGGLLRGGGPIVVDGHAGFLTVAGSVLERGRMRFAGAVAGLGQQLGEATLSDDGLALTITAQNRSLTLRKDACGNDPPQVTLAVPFGPTFPFGQSIMLAGQIQDEDTQFPVERLVFSSDRQGVLSGTRVAGGRTLFTSALQPGNHRVTLSVTDSGGLRGEASFDLTILNRPPDVPKIIQPVSGASVPAGVPVLLRGTGFDPDSGQLPGSALTWSVQLAPNTAFVALGTGNELLTTFAAPADPVLIRLTASDSTALQASADVQVRIVPGSGNAPPHVAIRQPDPLSQNGLLIGGATVGFPAHFIADAWDAEDPPSSLQLRWEFSALESLGGPVDPTPPAPNPAPITGTLAPDVNFGGANTFYRVTFTATDGNGQSSSESVEIYVLGGIIL